MAMQTTPAQIAGMHCGGCAAKIKAALLDVAGIDGAEVNPQAGTAVIKHSSDVSDERIRLAVASVGDYAVSFVRPAEAAQATRNGTPNHHSAVMVEEPAKESLYPLFLIVGFIAGVTLLVAASTGSWAAEPLMRHFMAGFFIVFSFFKLLDPPGFVSAYRGYDLVARRVPAWGWAYPFVELALGVAYLLAWAPVVTNIITLVLMLVGAGGVLKALLNKRAIRCACLGTALNLPMTKVTLVEDLTMAAMAAGMLLLMM
ncbi:MAG: cation transporter [Gammaproteobacteria bacterium]|nr:cation transporter [Gammaproteobacteria bacterium]